ncbi:DC-STAMP domain-containing protein 2 [Clonorchis sinensis]|uniref:DC-STAMP domain-containing protein 2 n=1 Tax=Clonorchis sinensis TaxID=79923 RepID=G7YJK1_CLOSI|nr:DC-STAMP domain-containing protein 2 [Clonorchis sinensis]
MHKEIQNQTATESQKVRDDEVGQTENPLFSGHMPKNHVTLSAISNRYMTENDWTDDMIHRPKMRRKRMEDSLGLNYANRPNWNRNVSNIQPNENAPELPDEELAERELLAQNKAIQRLERTACWLLPCTLVCKLLNLIFCTYKIEIGVPGKFKRSVGDPTKMLRQNIYGLLMGILTGFFLFLLFIFTFSNNPRLSTLLSAYVMLISVFGIAFSEDFRCIALLSLPYLVASRLRWLLMLFATAVSISGPGINFLHNSGNFRNSIACILAQVSTNMLLIQKLTAAPFSLLKNQLESLIEGLNETLNKMRNSLARINFSLLKVTNVMEQQSSWIVSLVDACGDPVSLKNQCLSFLNNIYFNCRSSMGPFAFLCGLVRQFAADTCTGDIGATQLCAQQKEVLQDKLEIDSKETLRRKMDNILNLLGKTNLSLQGNFDQYEKLTIESDNTVLSILQQRMDSFISMIEHGKFILTWIMVIWTLLTMLQLIIQAAIFRKSWIYRDTFDNYYITPAFVQQERRAMIQGLVPTIPLVRGETKRYKKFSSFTWTISEKKKAFKSFILLFMWMGVMLMITFADYAMYQILITVTPVFSTDFSTYGARSAMGQDYEINERLESTPRVHGESSYANIVRALLGMLNPIQDVAMNVDATACRPTASPPSKTINGLVYGLLGLTLLSIFFEGELGTRWLKWLEREFTDRQIRDSNPTSAYRLPLSRFEQPGSIPALVLPSGGMAAKHREGVTAEQLFSGKTQGGVNSLHMTAKGEAAVPPPMPTCFQTAEEYLKMYSKDNSVSQVAPWQNGLPGTVISHLIPDGMTSDEVDLMRRLQEEAARAGGWLRLVPNVGAWEQYASLWPTGEPHFSGDKRMSGSSCSINSSASLSFTRHDQESNGDKRRTGSHSTISSAYSAAFAVFTLNNIVRYITEQQAALEARQAFSVYLSRIKERLSRECEDASIGRLADKRSFRNEVREVDILMRFVHRASRMLSNKAIRTSLGDGGAKLLTPELGGSEHCLPGTHHIKRKQDLVNLLEKFIEAYRCETLMVTFPHLQAGDLPTAVHPNRCERFRRFLAEATESQLEELLVRYAEMSKSIRILLGDIRSRSKYTSIVKSELEGSSKTDSTAANVSSDSGFGSLADGRIRSDSIRVVGISKTESSSSKTRMSEISCLEEERAKTPALELSVPVQQKSCLNSETERQNSGCSSQPSPEYSKAPTDSDASQSSVKYCCIGLARKNKNTGIKENKIEENPAKSYNPQDYQDPPEGYSRTFGSVQKTENACQTPGGRIVSRASRRCSKGRPLRTTAKPPYRRNQPLVFSTRLAPSKIVVHRSANLPRTTRMKVFRKPCRTHGINTYKLYQTPSAHNSCNHNSDELEQIFHNTVTLLHPASNSGPTSVQNWPKIFDSTLRTPGSSAISLSVPRLRNTPSFQAQKTRSVVQSHRWSNTESLLTSSAHSGQASDPYNIVERIDQTHMPTQILLASGSYGPRGVYKADDKTADDILTLAGVLATLVQRKFMERDTGEEFLLNLREPRNSIDVSLYKYGAEMNDIRTFARIHYSFVQTVLIQSGQIIDHLGIHFLHHLSLRGVREGPVITTIIQDKFRFLYPEKKKENALPTFTNDMHSFERMTCSYEALAEHFGVLRLQPAKVTNSDMKARILKCNLYI